MDFFLIPLLLFLILHNPDYRDGAIFYWDEGQHLACINRLLHGEVIYRDIYNISAPLPEFIPFLMMKLSKVDVSVLRAYYYYGTLLSLFLIYVAAGKILRARVGTLLAFFLCAEFSVSSLWINRWGGLRVGSAYLSLLLLWTFIDSRDRRWLFLCGAAVAGALLFSPEMGIICFLITSFVIVAGFAFQEAGAQQNRFKLLSFFLAGFAAGFAPWFIYSIATHSFSQYLIINFFDIPFRLTKALPYGYDLTPIPGSWWHKDRLILLWLFWKSKTGWFILGWIILAAELLHLLLGRIRGKWDEVYTKRLTLFLFGAFLLITARRAIHELAPQLNYSLSPVLVLFTAQIQQFSKSFGTGLARIFGARGAIRTSLVEKMAAPFLLLALLGILLFHMIHANGSRPSRLLGPNHREVRMAQLQPNDATVDLPRCSNVRMPMKEAIFLEKMVAFLSGNTASSDPIFAFPEDGRFYFLCDRRNPTRFDIAINVALDSKYEQEAIHDLEKRPPRYVIHDRDAVRLGSLPGGVASISNEERMPLLFAYLMAYYRPVFELDNVVVLERKDMTQVKMGIH